MAKYPVRCCTPTKVLGYLDLPDGMRDGSTYNVPERFMTDGLTAMTIHGCQFRRSVDRDNGIDEIAVYSDDRPIEFWRSPPYESVAQPPCSTEKELKMSGSLFKKSIGDHLVENGYATVRGLQHEIDAAILTTAVNGSG